jgi:hypothetical protein
MALVHKGFSTFRLFAAVHAGFTEAVLSQTFEPSRRQTRQKVVAASAPYVGQLAYRRDSERRPSSSQPRASQGLPGSVFDARYNGLTAHAAYLDAAICRRERLR